MHSRSHKPLGGTDVLERFDSAAAHTETLRAESRTRCEEANRDTALTKPRFAFVPLLGPATLVACAALVAACVSRPVQDAAVTVDPSPPASIQRERLIGNWGIASFHAEKDRKRTEAEARAQCSSPYKITKGPTDGVMMHVADDPKLYELKVKGGPGGKTYVGFEAPAGHSQDREILAATDTVITLRFVDAETHRRYGTFIYVRCGR
jgi:hypothetical protein